jgi:hypothetical protein
MAIMMESGSLLRPPPDTVEISCLTYD